MATGSAQVVCDFVVDATAVAATAGVPSVAPALGPS
jgi:hypothetical protein